jgi:hypothetical protein
MADFRVGDRVHLVPQQVVWRKKCARAEMAVRKNEGTVVEIEDDREKTTDIWIVVSWDTKPDKRRTYRPRQLEHGCAVARLGNLIDG